LILRLVPQRLLIIVLIITASLTGCSVKVAQLPVLSHPYVAEVEFLKEVTNVNGKAKKQQFDNNRITSPFYFFLKVKEIENNGTLAMIFYEDSKKSSKKVAEKTFLFGESGKYYEYIMFFDQVEGLTPGKYRYVIFLNQHLLYEGQLQVNKVLSGQRASHSKP
jgi:hypothetical protein